MTAKIFLTISSIAATLYGLAFLLLPGPSIAIYGTEPEAHLILLIRYFGSALLAFGVLEWFGKDFRDWDAVRAVLIAVIILNAVGLLVTLGGMVRDRRHTADWPEGVYNNIRLCDEVGCSIAISAETDLV